MNTALAGLLASVGVALLITALTLPGRQTPAVINASAHGVGYLEQSALGQQPKY